jgi:hypothetical protein
MTRLLRLAVRFAEEICRDTGVPATPPLDLEGIAKALGLEIYSHTGIAEGCLVLRDERAVIELSPGGSHYRRRFTLAHELGHAFLLNPYCQISAAQLNEWPSEESFCNDFAAALLLPQAWLEKFVSERETLDLNVLMELAQLAQVSPTAVALRLLKGGLWQRCLLSWRSGGGGWRLLVASGLARQLRDRMILAPVSVDHLGRLERPYRNPDMELFIDVGLWTYRVCADVSLSAERCLALVDLQEQAGFWEPQWTFISPFKSPRPATHRRLPLAQLGQRSPSP